MSSKVDAHCYKSSCNNDKAPQRELIFIHSQEKRVDGTVLSNTHPSHSRLLVRYDRNG